MTKKRLFGNISGISMKNKIALSPYTFSTLYICVTIERFVRGEFAERDLLLE